jgi:hypothetical protein
MLSLTDKRLIDIAFKAGCQQFEQGFPGILRTVAREFAWERFVKDCEDKTTDERFPQEAPGHAYLLLCQEHLQHNEYSR